MNQKKAFLIIILFMVAVVAVFSALGLRRAKSYNVDFRAIHETEEDDPKHLELRGLALRKGAYDISIGYEMQGEASIEISLDNETFMAEELPADEGIRTYHFELKSATDRGRMDFRYPAESELKLAYITISSDRPMYYDSLIWGLFVLLLIPFVLSLIGYIRKSPYKIPMLITIGIAVIEILPFILQPGLHMGTDTRGQIMRFEGIFYGLMDRQFPVVVYPEWNNSYGQIGVLYPNLFLYIPAVARLIGMSQLGAYKLFIFLIIGISGIIAYVSAASIFDPDNTGAADVKWQMSLAVIMCGLDNMRLINMLDGGRFGGALLAEMFYPLVIAGLINVLYQNKKRWYFLGFGVAGVFCCHIMSATLLCIAIFVFVLCSVRRLAKPGVLPAIGKAVALFAILTSGIGSLFLKFYFGDWGSDKLSWEDFVTTLFPTGSINTDLKWLYMIILMACTLALLISMIAGKRLGELKDTYVIPAVICATLLFLMSTSVFMWGTLRKVGFIRSYTDMIQDAYRFLSLAECLLAFAIPKMTDVKNLIPVGTIICAACLFNYGSAYKYYFHDNDMMLYYDEFVGDIAMESEVEDYLPAGTETEWYLSDTGYISDEEAVGSIAYEREGTGVYYSYTNSSDGAYVEFPRFYYEGYKATDETGNGIEVSKGDKNRTRVYLKVTDEPAVIDLKYRPAVWMTVIFTASAVCWIGAVLAICLRFCTGSGILWLWEKSGSGQEK